MGSFFCVFNRELLSGWGLVLVRYELLSMGNIKLDRGCKERGIFKIYLLLCVKYYVNSFLNIFLFNLVYYFFLYMKKNEKRNRIGIIVI